MTPQHRLRVLAQRGYLPGLPVLVRVEVHSALGGINRAIWDAEAALSASDPGVSLSTNRVFLRNGMGSTLVRFAGGSNFDLQITVGPVTTNKPLVSLASLPVVPIGGILPGSSTAWSGVVRITNDVTVPAGHTLTILSNTLVLVNGVASGTVAPDLLVSGSVQSLGTEDDPVTITCADAGLRWGQIRHNTAAPSLYRYTTITRAGRAPGEGHTGQAPVIRPSNSAITFEGCSITDHAEWDRSSAEFGRPGKIMQAIGSDLVLRDCLLARARMGPEVQGTAVLCTNTWLLEMFGPDDSDGIYLHDQSTGQELRLVHSVMGYGDDDGIDTLNATATIEDCILRNWANPNEDAKGISAFNGVVNVDRCLIVDCWVGISGKWSSGPAARINVSQSTIIGISNTIAANWKANAPGPFIDFRITNSILWGLDALKTDFGDTNFSIGYSDLSESWAGTGNFFGDPRFADEVGHDYRLSPGSPCINAGDSASPVDPDGSRTDVGVFPFDPSAFSSLSVAITAPADGTMVRGPLDLPIEAAADSTTGSVARVEFFANSSSLGFDAVAPFQTIWSNAPIGHHLLVAVATDSGGVKATSAPVSVTIVSNLPPLVQLVSPPDYSVAVFPTNLLLTADASDPDGSITRVEFFQDALKLGEVTSTPFEWIWTNPPPGNYTLTAVALDNVGAAATSGPVRLTVAAGFGPSTNTLIALGSLWRYLDDGSNQGTNWAWPGYDDGSWPEGAAQLGFGDGDETTIIARTNSSGPTNITFYFRRAFVVENAARIQELPLNLIRDDGAIVYLNGTEVFRVSMPAGPVDFATFATTASEYPALRTNLTVAPLVAGTNWIAVEVHQGNLTSSDLSLDVELSAVMTPPTNLPPIVSLTSPVDGLLVAAPASLVLQATAVDLDGMVTNVAFHANGALLGSDASSPFEFTWPNVPAGICSLAAVASDETGQTSASPAIVVTVSTNTAAPIVLAQTPSPGTVTNLTQIDVRFSKPVSGIDAGDLLVNGIPAGGVIGSGSDYRFLFIQPAFGAATITWAAAHGISDTFTPSHAFDAGAPGATWQYHLVDIVAPAVTSITPPPGAVLSQLTSVAIRFTETVTGVTATDLRINGAPAAGVTGDGPGPYEFSFAQAAPGLVQFAWAPAHGIQDLAGNPFSGGSWSVVVDTNLAGIVISEIMYHPQSENPLEEYLELFNSGPTNVNLLGWRLSSGVQFSFPDVSVPGGGYLVVAADLAAFANKYFGVTNVVGNWTGQLSNTREDIDLDDARGRRVDSVSYADEGDWAVRMRGWPSPLPTSPYRGWEWLKESDGGGKSLELINPAMPNEHGQNWAASLVPEGTPGRANSVAAPNLAPLIVTPQHLPVIPRSTDAVRVSARVTDEKTPTVSVTLHYRNDRLTPPAFSVTNMVDDGLHGDGTAGDGIYGAVLPPQPHATVVEFYLRAEDEDGNVRAWPAPAIETNGVSLGQAANALYQVDDNADAGEQPIYRLIMTAREWQELYAIQHGTYATWPNQPGTAQSDAQMNGTFISVDGTGIECRYTVGIKNRGHGTLNRQPNNFRVNFNSDKPWKDLVGLNLNGQYTHAQIFGAALAQKSGALGADARGIQLRVNSTNLALLDNFTRTYGTYAANEVLNADWAEHHFPDNAGGNVYRAIRDIAPSDMNYRGDGKNAYTNTYFKTTNESEDDWTDLAAMLRVIGTNDLFTIENARQVIDIDQWLRHLAVMALFANQETGLNTGYNDDYFMYRGLRDTRFRLLYYDLDSILSEGSSPFATNSTLLGCLNNNGAGPAFSRLLNSPEIRQAYLRTLEAMIHTTFSASEFNSLLDQVLGSYVPSTTLQRMTNWMNGRRAFVQSYLDANLLPATNLSVAVIAGVPRSPTPFRTASITVAGDDVVAYRFKLNSGDYGEETPVALPITLADLAQGSTNTVSVLAKDSRGLWQDTASPTVSDAWVVNTNVPAVRLNEILARNDSAYHHYGTYPDAIELFNESTASVDLGGLRLTDDPATPSKFTFPSGTSLAAGQHLVLLANNPDGTPGLHLGFSLNQNGEGVFLFDRVSAGGGMIDHVAFGLQLANLSIGRSGTGGEWNLTQPTLGSANREQPLGSSASLRINEWLAYGSSSLPDDFVELFNPEALPVALGGLALTDEPNGAPDRHRIAKLSFIAGSGHAVFLADGDADQGANHLNFRLAGEQGQIALQSPSLKMIDSVWYGPQQAGVSSGRCPDGGFGIRALPVATPGAPNACPAEPPAPITLALVPMTNSWTYSGGGTNPGAGWTAFAFDDSAWADGQPLFHDPPDNRTPVFPEPVRTAIDVTNVITIFFRTHFIVPSDVNLSALELWHIVDDGAVFYLNGNEVARFNMPGDDVDASTLASAGVNDAAYQGPVSLSPTNVHSGDNVFAVELHQRNASNNNDGTFGARLDAVVLTNSPAAAGLVLNEILANNASLAAADGSTPDWIELHNPSDAGVDLAGMSLTDDLLDPRRWVFPAGTLIPPRGYLVILADGDAPASATNTGFGFNATGESVFLLDRPANGGGLLDSIRFGLQTADFSIGRQPGSPSTWNLTLPTPGAVNLAAPLGSQWSLSINEWMAAPDSGDDWFEIFNAGSLPVPLGRLWLTDDLANYAKYQVPALSFLGAFSTNGFQKFQADGQSGGDHVTFSLRAAGEEIGLFDESGVLIAGVQFGAQVMGVSQGRLPDGATNAVSFVETSSPGNANYLLMDAIVVNEILAHSDPPLEDAIELHNPGSAPADLSGWWLSDANDTPRKYQLPPGTILGPGGFRVVYENQFNAVDQADIPFALNSAKGDEVYLSSVTPQNTLTGWRAVARFGASANGVSFGRFDASAGVDFPAMSARSFGADTPATVEEFRSGLGLPNPYPLVGPVVISEIMYHPPDAGTNDNVIEEFVELHNSSPVAVPLFDPAYPTNTWRLRDAVDFEFAMNTWILPGSYLLAVSFDPATNAAALTAFQTRYGSNLALVGPYRGKLDNSDENVELYRPDTPQLLPGPDFGSVPYVLVERVHYHDRGLWPANADGLGPSLQRFSVGGYANDATNWFAAAATPGGNGSLDADGDLMPDDWELAYGLNPSDPTDAVRDDDGDGQSNRDEFLSGTNPRLRASVLRFEAIVSAEGLVTIRFEAMAGHAYAVEWRSAPDSGEWARLAFVAAPASTVKVSIPDAAVAGFSQRFYRIITPAWP